jgi:bisphosphoglycerate-independent phosphoglycerate mutase (AlkP superfamily)
MPDRRMGQLAMRGDNDSPTDEALVRNEFIVPTEKASARGEFQEKIDANDRGTLFNFREDDDFSKSARQKKQPRHEAIFTEYEARLVQNIVFQQPAKMKNIFREDVSLLRLKQFRSAESEKSTRLTFFQDYGEKLFLGEDQSLISSPCDIDRDDEKPKMNGFLAKKTAERGQF